MQVKLEKTKWEAFAGGQYRTQCGHFYVYLKFEDANGCVVSMDVAKEDVECGNSYLDVKKSWDEVEGIISELSILAAKMGVTLDV